MTFYLTKFLRRSPRAFLVGAVLLAASRSASAEELVVDPEALRVDFITKMAELNASNSIPDLKNLPKLAKDAFALPRDEGAIKSTPENIYSDCRPAAVVVGSITKCPDHADHWHGDKDGSGWIASPSGHIVTCNHVIEHLGDKEPESKMGIMTSDGKVYPIVEICSSDKLNDIIVVKVDTRGDRLPFLHLANQVKTGDTISIISHPRTKFWFFSQGIVAGFTSYNRGEGKFTQMDVSTEFGPGSSGAPVLDRSGAVVGMAQKTDRESDATEMSLNLFGYKLGSIKREDPETTMTFYGCAPLSALRKTLLGN